VNIIKEKEAKQVELKAQKFTSHSEIACTSFCPLKGYYQYLVDGTGIQQRSISSGLFGGSIYHDLLGCKADGQTPIASWENENEPETWDVDGLMVSAIGNGADALCVFSFTSLIARVQAVHTSIANSRGMEGNLNEQLALAEAQFWVFYKVRFPQILTEYNVLAVEEEYPIQLDEDIILGTKPDYILRSKADGRLMAGEQKTTGVWFDSYFDGWRYSAQTAIECLGIEDRYGEPCDTVVMEFLYKGRKYQGEVTSPLIRGYSNGIEWSHESTRKKGWEAKKVWEEMEIKDWIDKLPLEVLVNHHQTRSIHRSKAECTRWLDQARRKERRKLTAMQSGEGSDNWKEFFEGRWDADCFSNKYHQSCTFLPLCYPPGELTPQDLLDNGEFVKRESHYDLERSVLPSPISCKPHA